MTRLPFDILIPLSIGVVVFTAVLARALWRRPDYRHIHRMERENGYPLSAPVRRGRRH